MKFPFVRNRFKRAIEQGLKSGKLSDELHELDEAKVNSAADGEAVIWGLQQLTIDAKGLGDDLHALTSLFQNVQSDDCEAIEVLRERGIPELLKLFNGIQNSPGSDGSSTLLFVLKILALYATTDGTLKVIEAARQPLEPGGYLWSMVLGSYRAGHPQNELLFGSLREPLPPQFIGVSLLDAANAAMIAGESMAHPFDTEEGKQRLRRWLASPDPEDFSYAHSATAALAFIAGPEQAALLDLAAAHPQESVGVEAAWVAAKIGREDGIRRLAEYCKSFRSAAMAMRYLTELEREDAIPAEARAPETAALAEFAEWLAHPSELGRMPDELEIVDHRELAWPPERESKPFWLIKYIARDETGLEGDQIECGLVGSVTFCLFSYKLAQRPPEDAYAIHCYWEMEQNELIEEADTQDQAGEYDDLLKQWSGAPLEGPRISLVVEISPELRYPQRLVGLASARHNGENGWAVLDGDRSSWYPQSSMPTDTNDGLVLKVHVGRYLLGFTGRPNRDRYLIAPTPSKSPEQIANAYRRLLDRAQTLTNKKQSQAFDYFGPLGNHIDRYAGALTQLGRSGEIRAVIQTLAAHWDHASGLVGLGTAAFTAGQTDLAEQFFVKSKERNQNYERGEEMGWLAEIWCGSGKKEAAQQLLCDCLRRLLEESKTATGSDKQLFENWYQNHRATFLKLFPDDGSAHLAAQDIPASTLG